MRKSFSQDLENDIVSFESCSYDSNYNGLYIPKQAKMVANYIVWFLIVNGKENKTITYKDITVNCRNKYNEFIKHSDMSSREDKKNQLYAKYSVGKCLGCINNYLSMMNLPFISVLVVAEDAKANEIPQNGFFECLWEYRNIYKYDCLINMTKKDVKNLKDETKRFIVEDVKQKVEKNFDEIINALKILNERRYLCGYEEQPIERVTPRNPLIQEIENEEYKNTEKEALVKIRIGQSQLRTQKLRQQTCCEICGVQTKELLIVSHIKPWAESNDTEKLDIENTLLLCPVHDALFDKGFISFDARGRIKISKKLDEMEQALLNINDDSKIEVISNEKARYLNYHNKNRFLDNKDLLSSTQ